MLLFIRSQILLTTQLGLALLGVVLVERKGKFKVNWVHFVVEVKGIETKGHKGKVATEN